MSTGPGPTPPVGGSEHDETTGVGDAGVPGPGVAAPLFATPLFEGLDETLRRFAGDVPVLLALDFDGALAPIVREPGQARILPTSVHALARLSALPDVRLALVSGRDAEDLVRLAEVPPGTWVVGSHGAQSGTVTRGPDGGPVLRAEPVGLTPEQAELHARLRAEAEALVADAPGAWVQVKPTAVVVHTRPASREDAARVTEAALSGPGALAGVRTIHGKEVVEMAVVEVTKGDAVQLLREQVGARAVLYAGDDRTDEDAFAVLGPGDVSIKVGEGATAAAFRVPDPEGLSAVLMRLAELLDPA